MSLVKCRECGSEVSTEAAACPKCGAKPRKPAGVLSWLIVGGIVIGAINYAISPPPKPTTRPESQWEREHREKQELTFQKTAIMAATIKKGLREPESVQWEAILANDDASTMCFTYRARNGFGGMTREHISVANGKASKEAHHWNKHCANQSLNDLIHVRHALK